MVETESSLALNDALLYSAQVTNDRSMSSLFSLLVIVEHLHSSHGCSGDMRGE